MLRNYLTIAWRNLLRHKVFSLINILGLALGMAACLLILQYVNFEWSYDSFHQNGEHIYRIQYDYRPQPDQLYSYATTYPGVGPRIREAFPEVKDFLRLNRVEAVVSYQDEKRQESGMFYVDASFFHFFNFPLLDGNPASALTEPNTVVLSASTALRYFGNESPMGKTLHLNGELPLRVSGVFKDIPTNSHFKADILISFKTIANSIKQQGEEINDKWGWYDFYTYLELKPGTNPKALEEKLPLIVEKFRGKDMLSVDRFLLQPLQNIHLYSNMLGEIEANGSADTVSYLMLIALFILAIAWINYINLSTARSIDRAKEVGVRKVVGSHRFQLVSQFMVESLLLNGCSMVLALTLVQLSSPMLRILTGKPFAFSLWNTFSSQGLLSGAAILILLIGGAVLSAAYPAFVLSSFQPISVLKGQLKSSTKGLWLRRSLIVIQFVATVVLIVGTYTVYSQLQFARNQQLGINISQTLVVKAPQIVTPTLAVGKRAVFKNEVAKIGLVQRITSSSDVPGKEVSNERDNIYRVGASPRSATNYHIYAIDDAFLPTYQVEMAAGRNFNIAYGADSNVVILNEKAAQSLGFASSEAAIGQKISHPERGPIEVIGVIRNFHQRGIRENHNPTLFLLQQGTSGYFSLKINTSANASQGIAQTIREVQGKYERLFPGNPFEYFFLDDFYNQQYQADRRFGQVFTLFTSLAVLVACLGLFGLVSFTTIQRTKEIGVRKVLGATVPNILTLLSKDFLKLILLANLIAWPLAYWGIRSWLDTYAFRIEVSYGLFVLPTVFILLIALLTTSIQTWKAARANPVKALRYE